MRVVTPLTRRGEVYEGVSKVQVFYTGAIELTWPDGEHKELPKDTAMTITEEDEA